MVRYGKWVAGSLNLDRGYCIKSKLAGSVSHVMYAYRLI